MRLKKKKANRIQYECFKNSTNISEEKRNILLYGKEDPLTELVKDELNRYPKSARDIYESLLSLGITDITPKKISCRLVKLEQSGFAKSKIFYKDSFGNKHVKHYIAASPEKNISEDELTLRFSRYYVEDS